MSADEIPLRPGKHNDELSEFPDGQCKRCFKLTATIMRTLDSRWKAEATNYNFQETNRSLYCSLKIFGNFLSPSLSLSFSDCPVSKKRRDILINKRPAQCLEHDF